jgi:hypothetical protein
MNAADGSGEEQVPAPCSPVGVGGGDYLNWGSRGTLAAEPHPEGATTPSITKPKPKPGSTIRDRTPTISAVVRTTAGELSPNEEIALCLDGEQQSSYNYDSGTGKLTYTVQDYQQLSLGTHSARVTAYDLEVGMRATKEWTFQVAQRK